MSNRFDQFSDLPVVLQLEAIWEGELMLSAQLSIASSADQRALTWGGFLVTAATVVIGSGFAASKQPTLGWEMATLAFLVDCGFLLAGWLALQTVKPTFFCLPGNAPSSWLPSEWDCVGSDRAKVREARREQAQLLDKQIMRNAEVATTRAKRMHASFTVVLVDILFVVITLLLYLLDLGVANHPTLTPLQHSPRGPHVGTDALIRILPETIELNIAGLVPQQGQPSK